MKINLEPLLLLGAALHGDQRYGDEPYQYHLRKVMELAVFYKHTDTTTLGACALHDVLEDTKYTAEDLRMFVKSEIIDVVEKVTDSPGKNRRERKAGMYQKIKGCNTAKAVKVFDRMANVQECIDTFNFSLLGMYLKENDEFSANIFDACNGYVFNLKEDFDSLMFRASEMLNFNGVVLH